jgi:hypothetical protein
MTSWAMRRLTRPERDGSVAAKVSSLSALPDGTVAFTLGSGRAYTVGRGRHAPGASEDQR